MSKRTLVSHCRAWPHCHIVLHALPGIALQRPCNAIVAIVAIVAQQMDGNAGTHKGCPHCCAMGIDVMDCGAMPRHARHTRNVPPCPALTPIAPQRPCNAIVAIVAQQWMAMRAPTRGAPTIIVWRWAAMFAMPHMASQRSLFPRPPCWPHASRFASRACTLQTPMIFASLPLFAFALKTAAVPNAGKQGRNRHTAAGTYCCISSAQKYGSRTRRGASLDNSRPSLPTSSPVAEIRLKRNVMLCA